MHTVDALADTNTHALENGNASLATIKTYEQSFSTFRGFLNDPAAARSCPPCLRCGARLSGVAARGDDAAPLQGHRSIGRVHTKVRQLRGLASRPLGYSIKRSVPWVPAGMWLARGPVRLRPAVRTVGAVGGNRHGLPLVPSNSLAVIRGLVLFGFGLVGAQSASLLMMLQRARQDRASQTSVILNLAFDGGMGVGVVGFGLLRAMAGYAWARSTVAMLLIATGPCSGP